MHCVNVWTVKWHIKASKLNCLKGRLVMLNSLSLLRLMNTMYYFKGMSERSLGKNTDLRVLRAELLQAIKNGNEDAFILYLYGILLKKTCEMSTTAQRSEAIRILCHSIQKFPMNWGAWHELSSLVADQQSVSSHLKFVDLQGTIRRTLNPFLKN